VLPAQHKKSAAAGLGASRRKKKASPAVRCIILCTPGMGVNLWGESPLYVNPVSVLCTFAQVLAEGKGGTARDRLEEAGVQSE